MKEQEEKENQEKMTMLEESKQEEVPVPGQEDNLQVPPNSDA